MEIVTYPNPKCMECPLAETAVKRAAQPIVNEKLLKTTITCIIIRKEAIVSAFNVYQEPGEKTYDTTNVQGIPPDFCPQLSKEK